MWKLGIFCAFIIGLSEIFCTPKEKETSPARMAVATLQQPVSDVKKRLASELGWNSAHEHDPLSNYDAVRTGEASTAKIRFTDDSNLAVDERSMVIVVERTQRENVEESVVALPSGTVRGEIHFREDKPEDIVVRTQRGWIRASREKRKQAKGKSTAPPGILTHSSDEIRFKASVTAQGALEVHSEKGEIKVIAQNREKTVRETETVVIAPPTTLEPSPMIEGKTNEIGANAFKEPPVIPEKEWNSTPDPTPIVTPTPKPTLAKPAGDAFSITQPRGKTTVSSEKIRISGILTGSLKVYLRGQRLSSSKDGHFSVEMPLEPGINVFTFQIVSASAVKYETLEVVRR